MSFSNLRRAETTSKLANETFDIVIVGGGITGAGIALDAATRGLKVALLEMNDFASGTSSRSTKLVHGGLRYLKQFEIKEVAQLGRERAVVYENGPHVTTPERMLLPFHKGGTFGRVMTNVALTMYDNLAQVKRSERKVMISKNAVVDKVPFIKEKGLKGGGVYVEYRTDDARLTLEVMKKAAEKGATILNYAQVTGFEYDKKKKVNGVRFLDKAIHKEVIVRTDVVVNASGPWVDKLRHLDYAKGKKHLQLSKGVHIVFDQEKFPLKQAVYFDTHDKRMVFAIPRDGKTYVGTTDDFYDGNAEDMHVLQSEVDYLLKAIADMFPHLTLHEADVESSWAGVRPLIFEEGKDPSEISRKDEIWEAESNIITIAGGKLTGYRKMAETIVDLLYKKYVPKKKFDHATCQTKQLPISGGDVGGSKGFATFKETWMQKLQALSFTKDEATNLIATFGSNIDTAISYIDYNDTNLPNALYAKLMYSIHHEMVLHPIDFMYRRTGDLLFNIAEVKRHKADIIDVMAKIFVWSNDVKVLYTKEVDAAIKNAESFRAP